MASNRVLHNLAQAQLRADDPRRPLDWRFQRAVALSAVHARQRKFRKTDDKLTTKYAEMLYCLETDETFEDIEKVRKRFPDLLAAHIAYATLNATELALVDGLLLGRATDEALISQHSGLTPVQQSVYRSMFLDIADRREMSLFIAMQLMEPARLRGVATVQSAADTVHPEKPVTVSRASSHGSMPLSFLNTIRVIGFYSSPVVLELIYSGLLMGTVPTGRDSAIRFMTQSQLMTVRRKGLIASQIIDFENDKSLVKLMELSFNLAQVDREEGQIDIIQNIEAMFKIVRPRVGSQQKVLSVEDRLPIEASTGKFEWREHELVAGNLNGKVPDEVLQLEQAEQEQRFNKL